MSELRYAIRAFRRSPGFTITAVLTLALGIGATTAIFSVVNAVLLRPLPYRDPDRLVVVRLSYPDYQDVRRASRSFEETAVWATNQYNVRVGDERRQVLGAVISRDLLPLVGVTPVFGRNFTVDDDRQKTAILGYGLWQAAFGGDPSAVGRVIDLSGLSYTIVGVAPQGFAFPSSEFQLWTPIGLLETEARQQAENRSLRIFTLLGRLRSGVGLSQARSELRTLSEELARTHASSNEGIVLSPQSLTDRVVGDVRTPLLVVFATVGLLLLIACANVANLMLTRTTARAREMSIRVALGAGRRRLLRQLTVESLLLAFAGGAGGLLVATWSVSLVPAIVAGRLPRADTITIDGTVLLAALGASLLTSLVFGIAPALQLRAQPSALRASGRGLTAGSGSRTLRRAIAVAEICLSLVAVIGAGLLVRSFLVLTARDPGFAPQGALSFNVPMVPLPDARARARTVAALTERLSQIPGVEAAGGATGLPLVTPQRATRFDIDGKTLTADQASGYFIAATPDYFRALDTPILRGRPFAATDTAAAQPVVIVNKRLADSLFPGEDPIGRRLRVINPEYANDWRTIVGVAGDVQYRELDAEMAPTIYTPFDQTPFMWLYMMVRVKGDGTSVARSIRSIVPAVEPRLTLATVRHMTDVLSGTFTEPRSSMLLVSAFAALALGLAALGIYGVIAYSATQRTHEIGLRMALGAARRTVLMMVLREGLTVGVAGIAAGLLAAAALTRLMGTLLVGITPHDPVTFTLAAAALLVVAAAASYLPAFRATRVDPMVALRAE
jgi:putative ABC transport system permease protein